MKRKTKKDAQLVELITTIQGQLAVLDRKFDHFMTKSLTELAQAMAAAKPAPVRPVLIQQPANRLPVDRPHRLMYAVICYMCGKDCEIPFKPSGNRPVYCQSCFAKRKAQVHNSPNLPLSQMVTTKASSPVQSPQTSHLNPKDKKKAVKSKAITKKKTARPKKKSAKKKTATKKKITRKEVVKKKKA